MMPTNKSSLIENCSILDVKESPPERDAGFVSGGDDDDSSSGPAHSDDSGIRTASSSSRPPKKRIRISEDEDSILPEPLQQNPFRPWSLGVQSEPLELVTRIEKSSRISLVNTDSLMIDEPLVTRPSCSSRVPSHPDVTRDAERREHRNYKNMTRERRIEANARERTRVHTISAAFETLRRAVPSYSHGQKLSKLSVLRVACAYISALASDLSSEYVDQVTDTIHVEGKLRKRKDDPE